MESVLPLVFLRSPLIYVMQIQNMKTLVVNSEKLFYHRRPLSWCEMFCSPCIVQFLHACFPPDVCAYINAAHITVWMRIVPNCKTYCMLVIRCYISGDHVSYTKTYSFSLQKSGRGCIKMLIFFASDNNCLKMTIIKGLYTDSLKNSLFTKSWPSEVSWHSRNKRQLGS